MIASAGTEVSIGKSADGRTNAMPQVADRTAQLAAEKQRQRDLDAAMEVERQKAVQTVEVRAHHDSLQALSLCHAGYLYKR